MRRSPQELTTKLDYQFECTELLEQALRHRSAGGGHNERLEFLGDGVLNFVIASALFQRRPKDQEGELSRLRASLVKGETLAKVAKSLELGEYLQLGSGELKSGGFRRDSILADALEAVFGAVYLDGGFEAAKALILKLFMPYLDDLPKAADLKDAKTRLQEFLQSRKLPLPAYEVVNVHGKAHEQTFEVVCRIETLAQETHAIGRSRRKAEQSAAKQMLEQLQANA